MSEAIFMTRRRISAAAAIFVLSTAWAPARAAENRASQEDTESAIVVTSSVPGTPRATHSGNIAKLPPYRYDFIAPDQPAEALNRLPGVNIEQGFGVEHLTAIRSPVLTGGAGAGSFLYLEDSVPLRAAGFGNVNALMESMPEINGGIEIVRGPASARYGSNAVHGLINVLSRPPAEEPGGEVTAWAGPHDVLRLQGTASTTVSGDNGTSHGMRASFVFGHDGGFRDASGYDQQKARLRYDYDAPDTSIMATLTYVNVNQETATYASSYKDPGIYKANPNPEAYRDAFSGRAMIRIERRISDDQMLVITPYARRTYMDFRMHFLPGSPVEENQQTGGGMQSSYVFNLDGGHRIIAGFDVDYTRGTLTEIQDEPTVFSYVQGTHYDYAVNALVLAPYLQSEWKLDEATTLDAGARFEFTRYDYENRTANGSLGKALRIPSEISTFADISPKLGLVHRFNEDLTGFIRLARGTRAPQTSDLYRLRINETAGAAHSEILDSVEVGARGGIGRLNYSATAFFMKKHNFYFRDANDTNVANGKTQHVGVELELAAPLAYGFDIAASGTYARHSYEFDRPISTVPLTTESISSGDDVDTAPRTLANVALGYNFNEDRGRLELEWVHVGSYWMDAANTQKYPGHDIFNLRASYDINENLSVFGKVMNLFDTRYADRADYFRGAARYFPAEDRAIYAGTTVRF
ncbi:TonB-dependent receptor [Parvibaculum sp.]|uniref:TonB-dependent receptor n=1 Tax=Parvibaculum sp. TaxID=2024848 RepID=UPI0025E31DE4|nr:TonB-dependent receptor [Parvibaculum sp.]